MMDINFVVSAIAGDYAYANGMFEEASRAYGKALEFTDDKETRLKAGVAYIKVAEMVKEKKSIYLKKAKDVLEGLSKEWKNAKVFYYLGLALTFLGNYEEGGKQLSKALALGDEDIIISNIEVDITIAASTKAKAYAYLDTPELASLFTLLSDYSLGRKRERFLMKVYEEKDPLTAKAKELKRIYKKVMNGFLSDYLRGETAKLQAIALLYMWGESKEAIEEIKKRSKGFFISTEGLPPYTATVLDKLSNLDLKRKGLPFFIEVEIEKINELAKLMDDVIEGKAKNVKERIERIAEIRDFLPPDALKEDIIMGIKYLMLMGLDKLYKKALSIYSKKEASALVKAVVKGLPLVEEEKLMLLREFSG